jgi:hypothetical protein
MAEEKVYAEKYPRLWGKSLSADYPFRSQRLPSTPEDYQKALEEQKIASERRDREYLHKIAHDILFEILREPLQALKMPIETIERHVEKAHESNFNQLENAQEDADVQIYLIDKAVGIIERQYLSAENADRIERGHHITIRRGSGTESFGIKDYEEFRALMQEKLSVLKEVKKHHAAVLLVYQSELKTREAESPKIVASAVREAKLLVKAAQKLSKEITKAAKRCKKSDITDFEAAEKFIHLKQQFDQLEIQHIKTKDKIAKVCVFEDVKNNFPQFPSAPVCDCGIQIANFVRGKRGIRG